MSIALKLIPTRDDSYSGLESLTLIALSYNPKPSFVEHLQQCGRSLSRWFLCLSLSSDSISESYIQLLSGFQT